MYTCVRARCICVCAWCVCLLVWALGSFKGPRCTCTVQVCDLANSYALHRCVTARVARCHTPCEYLHGMALHGCLPGPLHMHMAVIVTMCAYMCLQCAEGHVDLSVHVCARIRDVVAGPATCWGQPCFPLSAHLKVSPKCHCVHKTEHSVMHLQSTEDDCPFY